MREPIICPKCGEPMYHTLTGVNVNTGKIDDIFQCRTGKSEHHVEIPVEDKSQPKSDGGARGGG